MIEYGSSVYFISLLHLHEWHFPKKSLKIFVGHRIFSDLDTLLSIITTFGIIRNSTRTLLGRLSGIIEKIMDFETS